MCVKYADTVSSLAIVFYLSIGESVCFIFSYVSFYSNINYTSYLQPVNPAVLVVRYRYYYDYHCVACPWLILFTSTYQRLQLSGFCFLHNLIPFIHRDIVPFLLASYTGHSSTSATCPIHFKRLLFSRVRC